MHQGRRAGVEIPAPDRSSTPAGLESPLARARPTRHPRQTAGHRGIRIAMGQMPTPAELAPIDPQLHPALHKTAIRGVQRLDTVMVHDLIRGPAAPRKEIMHVSSYGRSLPAAAYRSYHSCAESSASAPVIMSDNLSGVIDPNSTCIFAGCLRIHATAMALFVT